MRLVNITYSVRRVKRPKWLFFGKFKNIILITIRVIYAEGTENGARHFCRNL